MSGGDGGGAPVFLRYTQAELDRAYDQRAWATDPDGVLARLAARGAAARAAIPRESGLRYGEGEDEVLDLFPARPAGGDDGPAPVHVHLHGGAWRALGRADASFLAPAFVAAGVCLVVPDFTNLPRARMPRMADQVARAVAWAAANARAFGGDPARVTLSGHSSGAHLAAVAATIGAAPPGVLRAALCVSGSYDLAPVLLSARREYIHLDAAEARALSPARHAARAACPVAVAVGGRESPEFRRHALAFRDALGAAGRLWGWADEPGLDHFEAWEAMGDPATPLGALALRLARGERPSAGGAGT